MKGPGCTQSLQSGRFPEGALHIMNRKKAGTYKELQFSKRNLGKGCVLVVLSAVILQTGAALDAVRTRDVHLLDLYLLNRAGDAFIQNIVAWYLPILIGILTAGHFSYYRPVSDKIFTRMNPYKFLMERMKKGALVSAGYTLLFYLTCFVSLLVFDAFTGMRIVPGVSIAYDVQAPYFYYVHPLLYLFWYILMAVLWAVVFSLAGMLSSLYIRRAGFIRFIPFVFMVVGVVLCAILPGAELFSYYNAILLNQAGGFASARTTMIAITLTPLALGLVLMKWIRVRAGKDILS